MTGANSTWVVPPDEGGPIPTPLSVPERDEGARAEITVRLEEHFAENPLSGGVTFNHYRPARYLAEKVGDLTVPPAVLDRFERICSAVNKWLVRT